MNFLAHLCLASGDDGLMLGGLFGVGLARLGIGLATLAETVELAMGGQEVSRLQVGQIAYPIKASGAVTRPTSGGTPAMPA